MKLPLPLDTSPREAQTASEIPRGENWQDEPKWDGFRYHFSEHRSRHGTRLVRWRPDRKRESKSPVDLLT